MHIQIPTFICKNSVHFWALVAPTTHLYNLCCKHPEAQNKIWSAKFWLSAFARKERFINKRERIEREGDTHTHTHTHTHKIKDF
jgi:hypothetical protein